MSDEWQAYVRDPRRICKYGTKCFQKNPNHHQSFKHAPSMVMRKKTTGNRRTNPYTKKTKDNDSNVSSTTNDNKLTIDNSLTSKDVSDDKPSTSDTNSTMTTLTIDRNNIKYLESSPDTDHQKLKELFLVEMPEDFYKFYEFLKNNYNEDVEKALMSVNIQLIGPFELLLNKLPIVEDKELYLVHWSFFYDPPEFQAILKSSGKSEHHLGYYRDSPDDKPVFVASSDSSKDCTIVPTAENVFGAVYIHLEIQKKSNPFTAMACQKMMEKLKNFAETHQITLEPYNVKTRNAQAVARTFHGAGIVVPYDKKTKVGYRPLAETNGTIKKLFTRLKAATTEREKDTILSELQPVITYANIAVDECDFGTGLECGVDLLCAGVRELEGSAVSCLVGVYHLLHREAFAKIIQAHMKYRRTGPNMSMLNIG